MKSELGLGVMLRAICGDSGRSAALLNGSIGKIISKITLKDEALNLSFTDNSFIQFYDNGQSCCEGRYMRTDDELLDFHGAKFLGADIKDIESAPDSDSEYHEIQFLVIETSEGPLTMSSHVEHNGYYGGFSIEITGILGDEGADESSQ